MQLVLLSLKKTQPTQRRVRTALEASVAKGREERSGSTPCCTTRMQMEKGKFVVLKLQ